MEAETWQMQMLDRCGHSWLKVASSKGVDFTRIHRQINYPAMVQCLATIQQGQLWLTDTTIAGNPYALDMGIDYVAAERIPPLLP